MGVADNYGTVILYRVVQEDLDEDLNEKGQMRSHIDIYGEKVPARGNTGAEVLR